VIRLRVVALDLPRPVLERCVDNNVREALSGGFFSKPEFEPLGDLYLDGDRRPSRPFRAPWSAVRGSIHNHDGRIDISARPELPARQDGDLLQAGPHLVRGGAAAVADGDDREGFSAIQEEFYSDITDGPQPRTALAITPSLRRRCALRLGQGVGRLAALIP